jgi:hypothetical protein
VQAFEKEDHLVVSAFDSNGEKIEPDIAKKIFALAGNHQDCTSFTADEDDKINEFEKQTVTDISGHIAEKNSEFFDVEVEKLDKWADDMKIALELDLKKMDIDIKVAKTNSKKILNLDEKLKAQKAIKDMEKKRNEMRKKLFESQDEMEGRKEKLIDQVEAQLKQNATLTTLFTIRWKVI